MANAGVLTGTPRLSRGLMASLLAHSIWLPLVLGHASVDGSVAISANTLSNFMHILILDNVRADWGLEHLWERVCGAAGRAIG